MPDVNMLVCIPDYLKEWFRREAIRNDRSLSKEIKRLMEAERLARIAGRTAEQAEECGQS